jgi:hypothetical protein
MPDRLLKSGVLGRDPALRGIGLSLTVVRETREFPPNALPN